MRAAPGPGRGGGGVGPPNARLKHWVMRLTMLLCALISVALVLQAVLIGAESFALQMQMQMDVLEDTHRRLNNSYFLPRTSERDYAHRNDTAYVLLSLGAQTVQLNCFAAIETLVKIGGWGADVYVLTDRIHCWRKHLDWVASIAEMDRARLHVIAVDKDLSGGGVDLVHPVRGFRARRSDSFAMKARIFEFLPEYVKVVAYVDCDILFGQAGCPRQFVEEPQQQTTWEEGRMKLREGGHMGTFLAHREHSAEAMRLWKERMDKMLEPGDNDAYIALLEEYEKRKQLTGEANPLATGPISLKFERFVADDPLIYCMNHVSKARCSGLGREAVQRVVNRFRLETYENKYPYCTHPIIQPLLYGFMPWKYFGCPKVEKWL